MFKIQPQENRRQFDNPKNYHFEECTYKVISISQLVSYLDVQNRNKTRKPKLQNIELVQVFSCDF